MRKVISIGTVFGRLVVLARTTKPRKSGGTRVAFVCLCTCGTEKVIAKDHLVNGDATSCGCLRSELVKAPRPHKRTHGYTTNETRGSVGTRYRHLWSTYKLTPERYDSMVQAQGGVCAICKTPSDKLLRVDHDHACCDSQTRTCGKCIRGLLCYSCNDGLGKIKDSIEHIQSAIDYLDTRSDPTRRASIQSHAKPLVSMHPNPDEEPS